MTIDARAHVGDFRWSRHDERLPMTWEALIARLDDEGIDKAVFLPVYNASPELTPWGFFHGERMFVREQVIDAAGYADRVITFGNMDPRWGGNSDRTDFGEIIDWFQGYGCRGMGEICANIPYDDPRTVNMFRQLGARGLPVTIESCNSGWGLGFQDDPGSPRLEGLLQQAPEAIVIGHGPAFWAEIVSVDSAEAKSGYRRGPVAEEGSLQRLLRAYPNLYADLSAASAFNALSRDRDYGIAFVNEFQDRLLFATDIVSRDLSKRDEEQRAVTALIDELMAEGRVSQAAWERVRWHNGLMPQQDYLKALRQRGKLTEAAYDRIAWGNLARLLGGL